MRIKRRELLILISIWFVGCAIVAGLLGLLYVNSNIEAFDQPRPVATFTIPFRGDTAKAAYLLALPKAQDWQSDINLVAISTSWSEATVQNLGQVEAWDFRFFSTERGRLFFTIVTADGQVGGRAHLYKLRNRPSLIDPAEWVIDSDEALTTWINNGGGAFLETFPGSRVEVLLRQLPQQAQPAWDIIGISADQSQVFFLTIDAANGQILN